MMRYDEETTRKKKEDLSSLLASLVKNGVFGEVEYITDGPDQDTIEAFQYGSVLHFGKLQLISKSGTRQNISIVVKYQIPNDADRKARDSAAMFQNEVNMYKDVLPYLDISNSKIYPKFIYGLATGGEDLNKEILILENLKTSDFKFASSQCFLDYAHIKTVVENIAKLHSWSYTAKNRDPDKFNQIKSKLVRPQELPDENFDFEEFHFSAMKNAIKPLVDKEIEKETLESFLGTIKGCSDEIRRFLWVPKEPFAAIVHGDVCKNNLFYRYNSSGEPVDCAFFDFQMSRYACPVVDLSFFLYMHTDKTLRDQHWDEFLDIYWTSVRKNVPEDIPLPSKDEFLDYFACKAIYGFFPSSYFVKFLLHEKLDMDALMALPKDERMNIFFSMGGPKGQQAVEDMVLHLLERKYIQRFQDYYNNCL